MVSSAQFASSPIWIFAPKLTKFIHHLMSYFWLIIVREISLTNLFIFRSRDITIQNWKCWHSRFLSENEATSSDSTFSSSTAGKFSHFNEWLRQQGAILPVYLRKRKIDRTCGLLLNYKKIQIVRALGLAIKPFYIYAYLVFSQPPACLHQAMYTRKPFYISSL